MPVVSEAELRVAHAVGELVASLGSSFPCWGEIELPPSMTFLHTHPEAVTGAPEKVKHPSLRLYHGSTDLRWWYLATAGQGRGQRARRVRSPG